jgi:hypothetical protein
MRSLQLCVCALLAGLFFYQLPIKALAEEIPAGCPVTLPVNGHFEPSPTALTGPVGDYAHKKKVFLYGNEKLSVALPTNGTWETLSDFRHGISPYQNNLRWFRGDPAFSRNDGLFIVTLRKLNAYNTFASKGQQNYRVELNPSDHNLAVMKAPIKILSTGCWQITGHYKDQELSFVVWVNLFSADYHPFIAQGAVNSPYR